MYFEKVVVQNFRGIENLTLNLKPGINILIGDNGMGKTTALEAMSIALGSFLTGIPKITSIGIQQGDFRESTKVIAGASKQKQYYAPNIEFVLNVDGESYSGNRTRIDRNGSGKTKTSAKKIAAYAQNITEKSTSNLPVLMYMGISRVVASKRADFGKSQKNMLDDRRCGYIGCLDSIIDKNSILEWVQKMAYEEVLQKQEMPEFVFFNSVVSRIMQSMNELNQQPQIRYSATHGTITYIEDDKDYPVYNMSAGYQSLLWMIMDITFRIALLNPEIKKSTEAEGIILIDEIDMHLHPKWQWKILDTLQDNFPKIQFVVATHSPIIISSNKGANLIQLIDCNEAIVRKSAYAYPVDTVLTDRQDSKNIIPEASNKMKNFENSLNTGDMKQAQKNLQDMKELFGEDNPFVVEAQAEYDLENF